MNDNIILSKIAKVETEQQLSSSNIACNFLYKNKRCVLLDEFKDDAENIFKLIRHAEKYDRKEIAFAEIGGEKHLVLLYRNQHRRKREHFTESLLNAVYSNFETSLSSSLDINKKVLNTYVTSKLFEALQLKHSENNNNHLTKEALQTLSLPTKFLPVLRDYQKKSILWLIRREVYHESFPAFFEKLLAKDKETTVYKHLYSSFIQVDPPKDILLPPGGILADEMGMGKTVEMLALILLNPRSESVLDLAFENFFSSVRAKRICIEKRLFCVCNSNSVKGIIQCEKCGLWQHHKCVAFHDSDMKNDLVDTPYICPSCWQHVIQKHGLLKSKATFIVSPNTIKMQWVSEIKRHIQPSLRIFLYEGVLSGKWICPRQLAEYDIVITDYNIFRGDVYFTQENVSERVTRNKPRIMKVNTPILMIDWWRVVLDEAQMVESNKTKTFTLARMIPATNRWAVTGTPIQKSINDLQSLLEFIGFDDACENNVWRNLVNDFVSKADATSSAMINILQKCMWRTCKSKVASELDIPPQQQIVHYIQFDNLEKLFYNEQHAECQNKFLENVIKFSRKMTTISPQAMNIILQPFLKIRQSCTIPVVMTTSAKNNHGFNSQQQKQFLKPEELNDYLKSTNEILCKSELRAMASSHNGLAALYFLQQKFDLALKNYEAVLKLSNDHSDMNITVDSLLQIHALHNIMQINVLQSHIPIQNMETYENRYNQLEWKYLSTYANNLATVKSNYETVLEKLNTDTESNFVENMADGIANLGVNDEFNLVQKIREECWSNFLKDETKIMKLNNIQSSRTLLYTVKLWFNNLIGISKTLQNNIDELKYFNENVRSRSQVRPAIWRDIMQLVNSVYDCHLSEIREVQKSEKEVQKQKKETEKKELCKMCSIRDTINTFECLLFDKILDENTNFTEGLENPSFEMFLCKITFQYIKNKYRDLNAKMEENWSFLENLQLICKRLIKFWIEMEYTIKAYDELNMCKMRITLTNDPDDRSIFKIMESEIDGRILEQQNELMSAQNQFRIKMARLKYIKHLQGNDNPGPCPVCRLTEDERYAVLECGHHICFSCLKSMRFYAKGNHFKCSICRNIQQNEKIYYVYRANIKDSKNEKIKGNFSSKITCIVRLILKLKREHEESHSEITAENNVKILIFSQWQPIIQAIALALKENDIQYRAQCTPKTIEEFKNPSLGITCLLMPFQKGSKGLNLVEATHVFLVEPILNPGEELQAIGRVHRFGQKRETTVHRFIVNHTIEENIYNFIASSSANSNNTTSIQSNWEFDNISLADFENLFSLQPGECD